MLKLYFLGKARVEYDGNDITDRFGKKTIALLCLLVLNRHKYMSREKAVAYLWPDSGEETAKYNLRYNLWLLKKNIGPISAEKKFLYVDKNHCGVSKGYEFFCDMLSVMEFRPGEKDSIKSLQFLRGLCSGDFLEGYYFNHCNDFNEIIIFERTKFEEYRIRILRRLEELYEAEGDLESGLEVLKEILEIDPYDEETAEQIIRCYAKTGKRSLAIIWYNTFRNRLAGTLGIQPSDKLQRKYESIRENARDTEETGGLKAAQGETGTEPASGPLCIHTVCMPGVEWFWMAELVGRLFEEPSLCCRGELNKTQLFDLAYIRPDIVGAEEQEEAVDRVVPEVRIVGAFVFLLRQICAKRELILSVSNLECADEKSAAVIQYLEKSAPRLIIRETSLDAASQGV